VRIGIDLGGTKIEVIALQDRPPDGGMRSEPEASQTGVSEALLRRRIDTPRGDYAATLAAIADLVHDTERQCGVTGTVGVGTPGAISPATGLMKNCNSVWLNGRPLQRDLERVLERDVRIANDADCFALSEAVDGAGGGAATVFGAILGTGTGGGLVVNGRLLCGANAIAGEWGHNPLPWPRDEELPGPPCYCGKRGCIETFLSGPGLADDHRRVNGTGTAADARALAALARAGDPAAEATLERYADRLARSLASIVNVFDPEVIVLGGGVSNIASLYRRVPRLWGRYVFSVRVDTRLCRAHHGDSGGVRGAAWLWPVSTTGQ
jgi:fructokinase